MDSNLLIRDMPQAERPRERLLALGAEALSSAELLAILLRTGMKGRSAMDLGRQLIAQFGTLEKLSRATVEDLRKVKGVGRDKAIALKAAFTLAQRMARELQQETPLLDTPERIANLLRDENRGYPVEYLQVAMVNARTRLIRLDRIAHGTLDSLMAHPREIFRAAIAVNAHAIILIHNHPSGDPTPSDADIRITREIMRAGQLLKIEVLDHIILGTRTETRPRDFVSLRELGHFA